MNEPADLPGVALDETQRGPLQTIIKRFQPGGVGRHVSWLLLHSGTEAATMTVASLLAAKWMGPVAWGQLGMILAGVQLVAMMADGLYGTIVKYVSESRARENVSTTTLGWRLIWISVTIFAFVSILLAGLAKTVFPNQMPFTWLLLGVCLATMRGWRACLDGVYRGFQQFRLSAVAGTICTSLMAGAIIGFVAAGHRIGAYLGIMAVGSVVNCLWLLLVYRSRICGDNMPPESDSQWKTEQFLRYSVPLALRGILGFFFLKINIWLLGWLATDYDAGQFRLTDQMLTIPSLVLSAALAAVAPRVADAQLKGREALEDLAARINGFMLVLTIPMALGFLLNGPVCNLLFPEYAMASRMLMLFAPAMAVQGVGFGASILLIQGGKPGPAFWLTAIPGVANILFAWGGFKLGGVMGLTMGTAIVHFITYVISAIVGFRAFDLRFRVKFH